MIRVKLMFTDGVDIQMMNRLKTKTVMAFLIAISMFLSGCGSFKAAQDGAERRSNTGRNTAESPAPGIATGEKSGAGQEGNAYGNSSSDAKVGNIDLLRVKPNEVGKIMIVMFHNFVDTFMPTKLDSGEYTTTFDSFRNLLQTLYDRGYRLISLSEYLNNDISVPAGCIPMVFTFDDGTRGQFNLVEENGRLVASRQSAVGIMEEFNRIHPDFGLKGTFYVNLGSGAFEGKGTLSQRLQYLIDRGFEIGNHTMNHINLAKAGSAAVIQKEIGGNQKKMSELVPGYIMKTLALPLGNSPVDGLRSYVVKGEYEGIRYENQAIMNVGWDPALSPVSRKFNPLSTHRVRASGIKPVDTDLGWWLKKLSRDEQYISDGNPLTVTVPEARVTDVDMSKLNGKKLITY